MTTPSMHDRHPPGDGGAGEVDRRRGRRHLEHSHQTQRGQRHGADHQAAGGQGQRREAVVLVGGHHEVRRAADHRTESPQHPEQAQVSPGEQVEHQQQPERRHAGTGQRQPAGPLAVAQPQPHHDGGRSGELDQQRGRDLHVGDRGEVEELRGRDGEQPVADDRAPVRRSRMASGRAWPPPRAAPPRRRRCAMRASTTAPGVQPSASRPRASAPDRPNDAADTSANASPVSARGVRVATAGVIRQRGHDT